MVVAELLIFHLLSSMHYPLPPLTFGGEEEESEEE